MVGKVITEYWCNGLGWRISNCMEDLDEEAAIDYAKSYKVKWPKSNINGWRVSKVVYEEWEK